MKKFFALVLALVMALSFATTAWGADVTVGTYDDFKDAVEAGDNVKLNAKITVPAGETLVVDKAVTIDAAGFVDAITVEGTLTLNKGTVTSSAGAIFYVTGNGKLEVAGATIEAPAAATQVPIWVDGYGTFTLTSGTITNPSTQTTIIIDSANGVVNIKGGSVNSAGTVIGNRYNNAAGVGEINIAAGTLTSSSDTVSTVYAYSGTIKISGGTIDNTSTTYNQAAVATSYYAKTTVSEPAVVDGVHAGYAGTSEVTITGGTFTGPVYTKDVNGGTINISGGTFNSTVTEGTGTLTVFGGTFATDVSDYLAAGLTLTDDGVVVSEGGTVLTATTYDMVTTDAAQVKTVGVTANAFAAKAPKDTDKDGLLDQPGNVKYVEFSNMPGAVFVQVNTVGEADYAVYQTGTTTLFGYFKAVVSPYYEGNGVAFYNFGEKCGQYDDEPVADTKYYTFQGVLYKTVKVSPINLMVGNTLTPVEPMDDTNWVQHVPAYTYDKDYKVVGVKCAECGTEAVIYANWASVPKADKQAGNAYRVNDNDYYCWLAGPGAVVDTETKVESAETFDAGIAMYVGMSIMAATGSAVVIGKKKD